MQHVNNRTDVLWKPTVVVLSYRSGSFVFWKFCNYHSSGHYSSSCILLMLELKLNCDRRSVGQFFLVPGPLLEPITRIKLSLFQQFLTSSCRAPSLMRGRVFSSQCNHSMVRIGQNPWSHITVSSETYPIWRAGSHIYISQDQGGPVIPPGTGYPLRCLLRLARLRWRYSNPPPHGILIVWNSSQLYMFVHTSQETYYVSATSPTG
jgi:hypothetical protein